MNDEQIKEKLLMDNVIIKAMGEALEKMLAQQQRLNAEIKLINKAIYAIFGVILVLLITLLLGNLGIIT
jgi:flagellin-like protein|tara:strand:+ start:273 stop:479 length:207 start_codon:yes stop_codon:yes gene_type:complete